MCNMPGASSVHRAGKNLHAPEEIGVDSFHGDRSQRACIELRLSRGCGLIIRAVSITMVDLRDCLTSWVTRTKHLNFNLSDQDKKDLVEYLKGI